MDMENEVLSPIEPVQTLPPEMPAVPKAEESSYFDGNTWQLIGWRLLVALLGIVTFGIGAAWGQCMLYRWEAKHTVINGKRLRFDGNGLQLLGKWLLWGLLTLVTFGIYALFIPVAMKKWHTSHLRFSGTPRAPEPAMPVWKIVVMIVAALLVICLVFVALFAIFGYKAEPARIGSDSLWQSSHDQGSSSLEAKDYANAIQAFSSAIEADPDKAQSYIGRAEAYAAMGDMDAALEDMQSAQNKDDGSYDSQIRELMLLLQVLQMESQEQPQKVEPTQTPTEAVQEPQKQETPAQTYYVQAKGGLNLRKEPDKSSKALTTIPNGTAVVVTAWADNGWAQVTYKGHTGWCSGTYLKDAPAQQSGSQYANIADKLDMSNQYNGNFHLSRNVLESSAVLASINPDTNSLFITLAKILYLTKEDFLEQSQNDFGGDDSPTPDENWSVQFNGKKYYRYDYGMGYGGFEAKFIDNELVVYDQFDDDRSVIVKFAMRTDGCLVVTESDSSHNFGEEFPVGMLLTTDRNKVLTFD